MGVAPHIPSLLAASIRGAPNGSAISEGRIVRWLTVVIDCSLGTCPNECLLTSGRLQPTRTAMKSRAALIAIATIFTVGAPAPTWAQGSLEKVDNGPRMQNGQGARAVVPALPAPDTKGTSGTVGQGGDSNDRLPNAPNA